MSSPGSSPVVIGSPPSPASLSPLFSTMSISPTSESSHQSPLSSEEINELVRQFLQKQAEIGLQPAPEPLQKKYPEAIYKIADVGCISSVDSPDWRLREISVKSTEAIIDIFNQEFRTPMLEASRALLPTINPQNLQQKLQTNILIRMTKEKWASMPQPELARFTISKQGVLNLAVPHSTILGITEHCIRDFDHPVEEEIGGALGYDIHDRASSIFQEFYKPEMMAMEWLAKDRRAPVIMRHGHGPFTFIGGITSRVANEAGRKMILTGNLHPHKTAALLESYFKTDFSNCPIDKDMKEAIAEGNTFEGVCLSW